MASLFTRQLTPELAALQSPAASGKATSDQSDALRAAGYQPIERVLAETLQKAGVTLMVTRTDGANWPLARCAWADSFARWAHKDDVAVWTLVREAIRKLLLNERVYAIEDGERALAKLQAALRMEGHFDPLMVETIEAMIRLGSDFESVVAAVIEAAQ